MVAITVAAIVLDTPRIVPALPDIVRVILGTVVLPAIVHPLQPFQVRAIARRPATTLPAGAGNRPNAPGGGSRPGGGTPSTLPAKGGNRPTQTPSTRPSTNEARGYQRPQSSNTGAGQAARPNAFSGSGGGRAQSARGTKVWQPRVAEEVASGASY